MLLIMLLGVCLGVCLGGCEREHSREETRTEPPRGAGSTPPEPAETNLDQHFQALYSGRTTRLRQDAARATGTFCETLKIFLETPTDTNLALTRSAWITAHWRYQAAKTAHRLFGFPEPDSVDAWPALGGYIDRAAGYPHSGIVNDTTIEIDAKSLQAQHQLTDSSEVSIGFHALEYLLWGDPDDEPRTAALFQKSATEGELGAQAADRRREYLQAACGLLRNQVAEQAAIDPDPPLTPSTQLLARAAHLLTAVLAGAVERAATAEGMADEECEFSQQLICGVLPAVRELLELTEDPQLGMELHDTAPSLADALQNANNAVRKLLEELEEAWNTERGRLFAASLRALGDKLNASRDALTQPSSGV